MRHTPTTSSHGRVRAASWRLAVAALSMVLALGAAAPAGADVPCERNGNAVIVTIYASDGSMVEVSVGENGELVVRIDGAQQDCGNSTNTNTGAILVNGGPGNDGVLLDQSGPGGQLDEKIYVGVGLGGGNKNVFAIRGTSGRDRINFGTVRTDDGQVIDVVDRNGDGMPDGDLHDTQLVIRHPSGGGDIVSGSKLRGALKRTSASSATTLGPARIPLMLNGGPGNDKLTGGKAKDKLVGGTGNDTLKGAGGKDKLNGGKGKKDRCNGGPGKDKERGCE